jgi:hypothetical protein
MAFVTLPGATGGIVTVQAGGGDHIFVAQLIANTILMASTGGSLNTPQTVLAGSGTATPPPPTAGGKESILYVSGSGGGTLAVPTGYNYVVDLVQGQETITGSNVQVVAYDSTGSASGPGGTFDLTGNVSIAADAADDNAVTVDGSFNEATGDGNNTVTAIGTGTVGSGLGTNIFDLSPTAGGASGILAFSSGLGDTINVTQTLTGGSVTVYSSGNGLSLVNAGALDTVDAKITGSGASVLGGGTTNVTLAGTTADVFGGSGGALSVDDTGTGDTIFASAATLASVTLGGTGGIVFGGSNTLDASAAGGQTVVGGTTGSTTNVTLSGSANVVLGDAGALNVDDGGSSDSVGAFGSSAAVVSISGSSDIVFGGTNAITVSASGFGDTIVGGAGAASISIANIGFSTDDVILGGSGSLTINDQGQGDTIGPFGASSASVTVGGINDILFGGSTALNATINGTNDTVVGGSTASTIDASSGTVIFGNTGQLNFVGGAGTSTLLGATGGSELATVGAGGLIFFSATNNTSTIVGGSTATTVVGGSGSGSDTVTFSSLSGSGGLDFLANSGNVSLNAGGSGPNDFAFFASTMSVNSAQDTVGGWSQSNDTLNLVGYSSVQVSTVNSAGNFVVDLTNGAKITFTDVTNTDFTGKIIYS